MKIFFSMIFVIIVLTTACCKDDKSEFDRNQITMTTQQSVVTLQIAGPGPIAIHWGDSNIEKDTIRDFGFDGRKIYRHTYSGTSAHTITVTGKNIDHLVCSGNGLTTLDVSRYPVLLLVLCQNNHLKNLDVSNNYALEYLGCSNNELTELDVSRNPELWGLYCYKNQLTKLNLSGNSKLRALVCENNSFTSEALNTMFETLHNNKIIDKFVYIGGNPGTNNCDISIADNKGWIVNMNITIP